LEIAKNTWKTEQKKSCVLRPSNTPIF